MGLSNKKIKNATHKIYKGIKFKSKLECSCYQMLEQSNLSFEYESERIILMPGFYPDKIVVYVPNKKTKSFNMNTYKIKDITYTPDFIIKKDNYIIYMDVKGMPNDTYPIKKKLFINYLKNLSDSINYIFMEPHNKKQILECIEIIKKL